MVLPDARSKQPNTSFYNAWRVEDRTQWRDFIVENKSKITTLGHGERENEFDVHSGQRNERLQ